MRQIRIQTARKKAEALIERLNIKTVPVDVNSIAEALGLQIVYNELGEEVSGLLVSRDDTAAICVREGEPLARQRFTIAHEIGHFCLRHQFEEGEHVHVDEGWKRFAAIFSVHHALFVLGAAKCLGHPCQKHPSTDWSRRQA